MHQNPNVNKIPLHVTTVLSTVSCLHFDRHFCTRIKLEKIRGFKVITVFSNWTRLAGKGGRGQVSKNSQGQAFFTSFDNAPESDRGSLCRYGVPSGEVNLQRGDFVLEQKLFCCFRNRNVELFRQR